MKQLVCEMCGSTDLIKQDGVFVCQTCGTKYSVEEAKKMMQEGTNGEQILYNTNNESSTITSHIKNVSVGNIVKFGKYEQDNGIEEIEWRVLETDGHNALLISKYILEMRAYNKENVACTWEKCSLRQWLNSDFYNKAFDKNDKERIVQRVVKNDINFSYNTQDNVFLLSINEADKYFSSDEERQCQATVYAYEQGVHVNGDNGNCWWWLRSSGDFRNYAAYVCIDKINKSGQSVSDFLGVRPALLVKQES